MADHRIKNPCFAQILDGVQPLTVIVLFEVILFHLVRRIVFRLSLFDKIDLDVYIEFASRTFS